MAHFKHSNVISVTAKYWFFNIGPIDFILHNTSIDKDINYILHF